MTKTSLSKSDIMSHDAFMAIREQKRQEIITIKKNRRVAVGPDITVYFENKTTLWWQIQEMLRIEQGGDSQLVDELAAYAPLVPRGHELVATVMIEIADVERRRQTLKQLGYIEEKMILRFAGNEISGMPEKDTERTDENGKTSAVHFIRWQLTSQQVLDFRTPGCDVILAISHPNYTHKALLTESTRQSLSADL